MDWTKVLAWLGARLSEKTTYAGLTVLLALLFPHLTDAGGWANVISYVGLALGGVLAIVFPEKASQ